MRVLRLIKGVTRRNKLRNYDIRIELEVEPILIFIERNQLRWYDHVMRMDENRTPVKYYKWTPAGKRSIGRPRKKDRKTQYAKLWVPEGRHWSMWRTWNCTQTDKNGGHSRDIMTDRGNPTWCMVRLGENEQSGNAIHKQTRILKRHNQTCH